MLVFLYQGVAILKPPIVSALCSTCSKESNRPADQVDAAPPNLSAPMAASVVSFPRAMRAAAIASRAAVVERGRDFFAPLLSDPAQAHRRPSIDCVVVANLSFGPLNVHRTWVCVLHFRFSVSLKLFAAHTPPDPHLIPAVRGIC